MKIPPPVTTLALMSGLSVHKMSTEDRNKHREHVGESFSRLYGYYFNNGEMDDDCNSIDLLADLMHYLGEELFTDLVRQATSHYHEERSGG